MTSHPRRTRTRAAIVAAVVVLGTSPLAFTSTPAQAAPSCAGQAGDPQASVKQIRTALKAVVAASKAGQKQAAARRLTAVSPLLGTARASAAAQIGLPPPDPESDEIPGPGAVQAVMNVDHRIVTLALPLLAGLPARSASSLAATVVRVATCRDGVARQVAGLPMGEGGEGTEYMDAMADSLTSFQQELKAFKQAQAPGQHLPSVAGTRLTRARTVVQATFKAMKKSFGGGERPHGGKN